MGRQRVKRSADGILAEQRSGANAPRVKFQFQKKPREKKVAENVGSAERAEHVCGRIRPLTLVGCKAVIWQRWSASGTVQRERAASRLLFMGPARLARVFASWTRQDTRPPLKLANQSVF